MFGRYLHARGVAQRGASTRWRPARSATPTTAPTCWRSRRSAPASRSRVLSAEEEARLGYVAAVNSTTLTDGVVLDLGGGSLQLTQVAGRQPERVGARGRSARCG